MTTPQESWDKLLDGNQRFRSGNLEHPNRSPEFRETLANRQRPHSVIVSCSDSRITSEIIFDQGLGDLFIVRTAGHVLGEASIGSVEYAVKKLDVPLIVVMGHTHCGAIETTVEALSDGSDLPPRFIRSLVAEISLSIASAVSRGFNTNEEFIAHHTEIVAQELLESSRIISDKVDSGDLALISVVYDIETGKIQVQHTVGKINYSIQ